MFSQCCVLDLTLAKVFVILSDKEEWKENEENSFYFQVLSSRERMISQLKWCLSLADNIYTILCRYLMSPKMEFVKFFGKNNDVNSLADGIIKEIKQYKR